MNQGGEVADQMARESLQFAEVMVKLSALGFKNGLSLALAYMKENPKVRGKTNLDRLLREGKELKVISIQKKDLPRFTEQAKHYGVLFTAIKDKAGEGEKIDIMFKAEDVSKLNRIYEQMGYMIPKAETGKRKNGFARRPFGKGSRTHGKTLERPSGTQRDGYLVTDKVFDISQTIGNKEYPSHSVAGNTAKLKAAINALMEFAPVEVQYTSGEGLPAEYIPESELLECRKDVPPEDVFRYLPQAIILGCTHLHGEGGNEQELTKLYALAVSVELCGHFGITPVEGYKEMLNSFKDHVPQGEERAMLEEIREFSCTMGDTISKAVMQVREQRIAENRSR